MKRDSRIPNTPFTTLILDFDGVIVESIPLKTVAFQKIFSFAPPEHLDEIIAFHLENGGMSRYPIIRSKNPLSLNIKNHKIFVLSENTLQYAPR
jgi:beta-phosphoglucomutase-like phosphatase (HAD superfamily)